MQPPSSEDTPVEQAPTEEKPVADVHWMTTDDGVRVDDQSSLKAGYRGPVLLEDFRLRQKLQHFDHERIPERVIHARGAGAFGYFQSYTNISTITAAPFLFGGGRETPVFVRFSTLLGSRGSADTVRDLHGFAVRFYTNEGNFDLVGSNIPVSFVQDAIQFPDLIHALKPRPDREIPGASSAHDSAWDYFGSQPSTLHALLWTMSGHGTPRSYRHMQGFGVHTYRLVNECGTSVMVKWHWYPLQGVANLIAEEARVLAGKDPDYHRRDLSDSIDRGLYPRWELSIQIVHEKGYSDVGFDPLDPTKFIPFEKVPLLKLGILTLDENAINYFAETEQVMFQPGHIVRGIDFTEDPLLQGRLFSYQDSQLNRHGGPNFAQLPINRPRANVSNNYRDGAGQMSVYRNQYPYYPNSLADGGPVPANLTHGDGFWHAPHRWAGPYLTTDRSPSKDDHWTQPRLFWNSLIPVERQFLVNAIRLELKQVQSKQVKLKALAQLNKVSFELARRVGSGLELEAPGRDPLYYHSNATSGVSAYNETVRSIAGMQVAILTRKYCPWRDSDICKDSIKQAQDLKAEFDDVSVIGVIVAEAPREGLVNKTYAEVDASMFDGVIVTDGAQDLFGFKRMEERTTLYPVDWPAQILIDAYRYGKPVGGMGSAFSVLNKVGIPVSEGTFQGDTAKLMVFEYIKALHEFKFLNRFPVDEGKWLADSPDWPDSERK